MTAGACAPRRLVVATDVTTPFMDAARVFGPQKGASPEQVSELTTRLEQLVERYRKRFGVDVSALPGAGAAGGLAGGLAALGARIVPGFDLVASIVGLSERVARADRVLTGEGHLDPPSLSGKVVGGVIATVGGRAPILCVVGDADPDTVRSLAGAVSLVRLVERAGARACRATGRSRWSKRWCSSTCRGRPISGETPGPAPACPPGALSAIVPGPTRRWRSRPLSRPGPTAVQRREEGHTMGLLDGKVAIVTGAGRGIGREEALVLAREGATVVVNDVGGSMTGEGGDKSPAQDVVDTIAAAGGTAAVNSDDISSWKGGQQVVEQAVDTYGSLDILVNNAGILRDKMSFNMDESDWDDVIRVHLKGHFAATHFAAVYWRNKSKSGEATSGRIINTSSEAGLYGNAGQANYSAAKLGIVSMTWVLARELDRYGVTANAIAPRARTRMTENLFGDNMAAKQETASTSGTRRTSRSSSAFWPQTRPPTSTARCSSSSAATSGPWAASTRWARCTAITCGRPRSWWRARASSSRATDSGIPKFSFF